MCSTAKKQEEQFAEKSIELHPKRWTSEPMKGMQKSMGERTIGPALPSGTGRGACAFLKLPAEKAAADGLFGQSEPGFLFTQNRNPGLMFFAEFTDG